MKICNLKGILKKKRNIEISNVLWSILIRRQWGLHQRVYVINDDYGNVCSRYDCISWLLLVVIVPWITGTSQLNRGTEIVRMDNSIRGKNRTLRSEITSASFLINRSRIDREMRATRWPSHYRRRRERLVFNCMEISHCVETYAYVYICERQG